MDKTKYSISELEELAMLRLGEFLDKDKDEIDDKDIEIVKVASSTRGTNSRLGATKRVGESTQLAVIKSITKDAKEIERYVRATLPDYLPSK